MEIRRGSGIFLFVTFLHLHFCSSIHGCSYSVASFTGIDAVQCVSQTIVKPARHVSIAFGGLVPSHHHGATARRTSGCCLQGVCRRMRCAAVWRRPRWGGINTALLTLKNSVTPGDDENVEPAAGRNAGKKQMLRKNSFVRVSVDAREKMAGSGWHDETMNQTVGRVGEIVQFLEGGALSGQTLCIVNFENTRGLEWIGRKVLLMECLEAADSEKGAEEERGGGSDLDSDFGRVQAGEPTLNGLGDSELGSGGGGGEDDDEERIDLMESVMDLDAMVQESASRLDALVRHANSELGSRNLQWEGIVEQTTFGKEVERVRGELRSIRYGVEGLLDSSLRFGADQRIGMPGNDGTEPQSDSEQQSTELASLFDADGFRESCDSRVGIPQEQKYGDGGDDVSVGGAGESNEEPQPGDMLPGQSSMESIQGILSSLQFPGAPPGADANPEKANKPRGTRAARTPRVKQVAVSETQYIKVMEYVEGDGDEDEYDAELAEAEPQLRMEEGPSVDYSIIPRPFYYPKADVDLNPIYASFRNGSGIVEIKSEAKSKYEKLWVLKGNRLVREAILEKQMREAERERERERERESEGGKVEGDGGTG